MQIREFRMDDYDTVLHLWRAAGIIISRSDDRTGIAHKLEHDADLFLVGIENDVVVGP